MLLEAARLLSGMRLSRTVEFVAFTLEEPQTTSHIILRGSREFARQARRQGVAYGAVLILECVGYTSRRAKSQLIPRLVGIEVPATGDFLGVIANRRSRELMVRFHQSAAAWASGLTVVPYAVPLNGYFIPQTRFSDHAPFWDRGYPALMLTDTAMFRNPHYHTPHDTPATLDYDFMAGVARATLATLLELDRQA